MSRPRPAGWALGAGACLLVVAAVAWYGPSRRTYLERPAAVGVESVDEFRALCEARGVRGRLTLVFARDLIPAAALAGDSAETQALLELMGRGHLREVFHVVPEEDWAQVAWSLDAVSIYRSNAAGRLAVFDEGRVNVSPLSRLWPPQEPAVVLLDAAAWGPLERQTITRLLAMGHLRTDLFVVLRGGAGDLAHWRSVVASSQR